MQSIIKVDLGPQSYNVCVRSGGLDELGSQMGDLSLGKKVLLVSNQSIFRQYGERATAALESAGLSDVQARDEAGRLWHHDTADWDLLVRHDVTDALPVTRAPLPVRRPVARGDGLFLCGDHQDTPSTQGALASGHRTAQAVLRTVTTGAGIR